MRRLDFSKDPHVRAVMNMAMRVNALVGDVHGRAFNLSPGTGTFEYELNGFRGNSGKVQIRMNDTVPNPELFSLAMELVRPADEEFVARKIFEGDGTFHVGSQTVGYDVITEEGEAKLVATGRTTASVPKASATVSRALQAVVKIMSEMEITRDDIQQLQLRADRGISPLIDFLQEKTRISMKNIARQEDYVIWTGGNIEGIVAGRLNGVMDYFSTTPSEYEGKAPTKGKEESVLTGVGGDTWALKTSEEIVRDIRQGAAYLTRNGTYTPRVLALPHSVITESLAFRKTSDLDTTPLLSWIKKTFSDAYGVDFQIIGTRALEGKATSGTTRGNSKIVAGTANFLLMDNSRDNMVIADVEPTVLLPSQTDTQGTIHQIAQIKTGGFMLKHPSAMYMGTGIAA